MRYVRSSDRRSLLRRAATHASAHALKFPSRSRGADKHFRGRSRSTRLIPAVADARATVPSRSLRRVHLTRRGPPRSTTARPAASCPKRAGPRPFSSVAAPGRFDRSSGGSGHYALARPRAPRIVARAIPARPIRERHDVVGGQDTISSLTSRRDRGHDRGVLDMVVGSHNPFGAVGASG